MASDQTVEAAQAGPPAGAERTRGVGRALILPHRASAILAFGLIAACGCGVAVLAGLALHAGGLWAEGPEGELLEVLAYGLLLGSLVLASAAWAMASADLARMARGEMDASGRGRTRLGKLLAVVLVMGMAAAGLARIVLFLVPWQWL